MSRRTVIENKIIAKKRKIAAIDDRIGRMMSFRVDEEEKLAGLYDKREKATGDAS